MTEEKKVLSKKSEESFTEDQVNSTKSKSVIQNDIFAEFDLDSIDDQPETLLKAGVHFGHQKSRRHPRMQSHIFTSRGGVSIIDLTKTREGLNLAIKFLVQVRKSGKQILFATTKKQALNLVKSAALRAGEPYVINRWLGGTFTNFPVISKRVKYLIQTEEKMTKGAFRKYTKFEQLKKQEEINKLNYKMGGLKKMTQLPGAVVVMDVKADNLVVVEARKAGVPIVAITDTNVDPSLVDYPIPGNDDAISSLRLILALLLKSIVSVSPTVKEVKKTQSKSISRGQKNTDKAKN